MSAKQRFQIVAWSVDIHSMVCIVFAATKAKAQWVATASYWDAGYGRKGVWPGAKAVRTPVYDACPLRDQKPKAWCEEYVSSYPRP